MQPTTPADDQYDERRALFNALIDGRPRRVASWDSRADDWDPLPHAAPDSLAVAVRSGGRTDDGQENEDIHPAG